MSLDLKYWNRGRTSEFSLHPIMWMELSCTSQPLKEVFTSDGSKGGQTMPLIWACLRAWNPGQLMLPKMVKSLRVCGSWEFGPLELRLAEVFRLRGSRLLWGLGFCPRWRICGGSWALECHLAAQQNWTRWYGLVVRCFFEANSIEILYICHKPT